MFECQGDNFLCAQANANLHDDRKRSTPPSRLGFGLQAAVECKAYINQLSKQNCPFATDRRFIGGEWLYKTSTLHQSEPLPDKRYLSGEVSTRNT